MSAEVTLRSAHDGTTLRFREAVAHIEEGGEGVAYLSFSVSAAGPRFEASATVDGFESQTLASYFKDIAAKWKGWKGEKTWSNLEDELRLIATSDRLGHVYLSFTLRSGHHDYSWSVTGRLLLEAGQLDSIAADFARFYTRSVV